MVNIKRSSYVDTVILYIAVYIVQFISSNININMHAAPYIASFHQEHTLLLPYNMAI